LLFAGGAFESHDQSSGEEREGGALHAACESKRGQANSLSADMWCAAPENRLVERYLMDDFEPQQMSTFALTLFKHTAKIDGEDIQVDFWDTAGQERFSSMHPSYYHQAHACLFVFDVTRKVTYKNLLAWHKELREYREDIPCIVVANKIDAKIEMTQKQFSFGKKNNMPFYFVSAADGTNVVKVFTELIKLGNHYKNNSTDFMDEVMKLLAEQHEDP
jgi:Rab-like protein 2